MAYIFEASIVCAVFSMTMIVLRAAMYPVKEPTDASSSGDLDIVEALKFDDEQRTTNPLPVETTNEALNLPIQSGMDGPSSEDPNNGSGTSSITAQRTNVNLMQAASIVDE